MNKKKTIVSLATAIMLTMSAGFSTFVHAEEVSSGTQAQEEKALQKETSTQQQALAAAEQSKEQAVVSITSYEPYDIEEAIGTNGRKTASISRIPDAAVDLSNYELYINRKSTDSNIVVKGMDSLEGVLDEGKVNDSVAFTYEIPKNVTGSHVKFTLQVREKETGTVIGESKEYTIYPYEVKNGVLTYRDPSKSSKYLLTVEMDSYTNSWYVSSDDPRAMISIYDKTDRSYDYYLSSDQASTLILTPQAGGLIKHAEMISSQAGTIEEIEDFGDYATYAVKLKEPATIKVTSMPATEAKAWQSVVKNYIANIRSSDWFTGDEINDHFYEDTALPNDVALVTVRNIDVINNYDYNTKTYNYEIPYDEFVTIAKDYFVNVPDLKTVDIWYAISYDETIDCMVVPSSGVGNPMLITEFVEAKDIDNGRYAIHFKVSKEEWDSEVKPDMQDKTAYTECTLTVEDNGKGQWRYISFEKGYTEGTAIKDTPSIDKEEPTDEDLTGEDIIEEVSTIVEKIESAETGSTVTIDMSQSTVVSKDVLAVAKGKDVNLVLEMDGYSWIINGKEIQDAKDIDFGVSFQTNAIPADVVKAIAGDHDTKQLSLAHDGEFCLKAQLQIYVGKDYAKQYGKLYWYHNGALELVDTSQTDANGLLTLTFTHASDYVIVFDDQKQTATQDSKTETDTPATGDQTNVLLWSTVIVISLVGAAVTLGFRRRRSE